MFRGYLSIVYKEARQIRRDRTTLIFIMLVPVVQLLIFGYAINTTVSDVSTVVLNLDKKQESRNFLNGMVNTSYFEITKEVSSDEELVGAIVSGEAKVGVKFPPDYSENLLMKRTATVQVLIDGSDSTIANQALGAVTSLGLQKSIEIVSEQLPGGKPSFPIEVRPRMLFNPDSRTANFMVPALIAIILQITTVILTSISIVKEKEKGTLEQLLVTPVEPFGLMLGKLTPYCVIGFTQANIVLVLMWLIFDVTVHGNLFLLLSLILLFIFTALGLGLLISTKAQNPMQAFQMAFLVMLPSILLSGFMFPRESMPLPMFLIGYIIPATYLIDIMRGIVLRGAGFLDLLHDIVPLFFMGIFFITLAAKRFKKNIG